jgi:hypothetical protein
MLTSSTYTGNGRTVTIGVERSDTWQESTERILNFPSVVELADNHLFMRIRRSQHGIPEPEPHYDVYSTDGGETWGDPPEGLAQVGAPAGKAGGAGVRDRSLPSV